jgi:hypothetical protein
VDERTDPVEILARVSEDDDRERAFGVWVHKATKAGWARGHPDLPPGGSLVHVEIRLRTTTDVPHGHECPLGRGERADNGNEGVSDS